MNKDSRQSRALSTWLFACCLLVFAMIIVGALTRLTGSGLSITEWKPVTGAIPPLNEAQWHAEFDLYKQSPQFEKENFWMELADFKLIYFWEWFHRLLGRLIGLAYALPLLVFWARGMIPTGRKKILSGIFLLGAAQGFMGWYMVQSGLVDIPAVSHYRLAAHLGLALLIYALMFWQALDFRGAPQKPSKPLFLHTLAVFAVSLLTLLWGAFTAGLDAGLIYNESFPLMGGKIVPPDMWFYDPAWLNIFENRPSVQFVHRWLAVFTAFAVLTLWLHAKKKNHLTTAMNALAVMVLIQVGLGIAALLSGLNIALAVTHQAGAVILFTLLIVNLRALRPSC